MREHEGERLVELAGATRADHAVDERLHQEARGEVAEGTADDVVARDARGARLERVVRAHHAVVVDADDAVGQRVEIA